MGIHTRAEMPSNFYDITSTMLLAQPEPQFLYAQFFKNALGASLQTPSALGLAGRTAPNGGAADYSPAERDRLVLESPISTDLFAATVDFGGMPGSTIRFNRPVFTNSTYTQASRLVASGTTISTTPITVAGQQTNLTLQRFGGPYSTAVQPYGVDALDSSMGVHRAASIFGTQVRRDFDKFLDSVWVTLLDLAATAVYPEGMSTVNDPTQSGQYPMTLEQVFRTEAAMDTANLPTFSDGFRILVLTPTQVNQLRNNAQFRALSVFMPQFNPIFPGYVASIGKFHIFKSTTLSVTNNASSVPIHYGHAIAPGVGLAGMGRAPRVAPNTNDNYGETILFIWIAYLAFGLANNAFVYSVRSSA